MKTSIVTIALLFVTSLVFAQKETKTTNMEARFTVLTLGVDNVEKAYKFYHEGLGFASSGIIGKEYEHGEAAFFDLKHGMKLAIYSRANLAWDSKLKKTERSATEFSIGYMTRSEEEVDAIMSLAKKAGATITKPAQAAFWGGYSGYFQDPDGHLWEVLYNPQMLPE